MVSEGEKDFCSDASEEAGDCLLATFDRSFRRMR
jgi:hypothetical protein